MARMPSDQGHLDFIVERYVSTSILTTNIVAGKSSKTIVDQSIEINVTLYDIIDDQSARCDTCAVVCRVRVNKNRNSFVFFFFFVP